MGTFYWPLIFVFVVGCGPSVMKKEPKTLVEICQNDPSVAACKYLD